MPDPFLNVRLAGIRMKQAFMRFKGHGCNYSDDRTWATYESIASSQNSGKIDHWSAKVSEANSEAQRNVADKKCAY